jgi:hypothetical protein
MSKSIAIMQPYFLPYIGYWQLMNAVDQFVIYDNIQFTKKGWINRNRFLLNGQPQTFTLPLKKGSDYLDVAQRYLSDDFEEHAHKLSRKFEAAYAKAPHIEVGSRLLEECFNFPDRNLFNFIHNSIEVVKDYLEIDTELVVSSSLEIDHDLRAANKVKAICASLNTDVYVNPHGGTELYDKQDFNSGGITLKFLQPSQFAYHQNQDLHTPWLSIIDLIMFCDKPKLNDILARFNYL